MNTFVIGDIHGADKALKDILILAGVTTKDRLIFLGDYVDGWSGSAAVIDMLLELDQTHSCIFIKGNHDAWCEDWLQTGAADHTWLAHGGRGTINSYSGYSNAQKLSHTVFFNRMRNFYTDDANRLFIHAGFSSMHGPEHEHYSSNFKWDRTLWEMALTMDPRIKTTDHLYPKRLKLFSEIFIGHTPTLNYDSYLPMQAVNVWNIDTGAAFYGKLTIMNVETKDYWQSDIVRNYYPGETGRKKS